MTQALDGDRESTSLTFSQFTATAGERNNTPNNDSAHTQAQCVLSRATLHHTQDGDSVKDDTGPSSKQAHERSGK